MEEMRKIILSLIILSFMSLGWGLVQLEIENVNINDDNTGTLDIYMSSFPSCSYCEDPVFNNNNIDWRVQKEVCESDLGNSTWVVNTEMTEEACAEVPSVFETGGWWFDGNIAGYQFFIDGVTATEISSGLASEYFDILLLNSYADCDCDAISDLGCNLTLGASTTAQFIPQVAYELLITINFNDYQDNEICFGGTEIEFIWNSFLPQCSDGISEWDAANWTPSVISDANAIATPLLLGDCYTPSNEIIGCTYPEAKNYNPEATNDDGSCEFMWGDVNHDGALTIQDLILIVNEILSF